MRRALLSIGILLILGTAVPLAAQSLPVGVPVKLTNRRVYGRTAIPVTGRDGCGLGSLVFNTEKGVICESLGEVDRSQKDCLFWDLQPGVQGHFLDKVQRVRTDLGVRVTSGEAIARLEDRFADLGIRPMNGGFVLRSGVETGVYLPAFQKAGRWSQEQPLAVAVWEIASLRMSEDQTACVRGQTQEARKRQALGYVDRIGIGASVAYYYRPPVSKVLEVFQGLGPGASRFSFMEPAHFQLAGAVGEVLDPSNSLYLPREDWKFIPELVDNLVTVKAVSFDFTPFDAPPTP